MIDVCEMCGEEVMVVVIDGMPFCKPCIAGEMLESPMTEGKDLAGDMFTDYPEDRPHDQMDDVHNYPLEY